jgi:1,4-alpha-glucan branching enzyme
MVAPLGPQDFYLFNEGTHTRIHERLGAHLAVAGVRFAVWAPNAAAVAVVGDWDDWREPGAPLAAEPSGIWHGVVSAARHGSRYKYRVTSRQGGAPFDKADPVAFRAETPPATASVVWDLAYEWGDAAWLAARAPGSAARPMSIYEIHLGSWRRVPEEHDRWLTYRELAPLLAEHAERLGFTHVELLPVMEHPFYGSWGYQVTGFFAATSRHGTPQDLMFLIDHLHQRGIGVILDWVPAHFPADAHALAAFDGTHLYEHADPRQGRHPDWGSAIFNYGRHEVRSFLLSSAAFWIERYHADALRVDAVSSMLYLDYSRPPGEWVPNVHGGNENLDAVQFLHRLAELVHERFPGVDLIAEEATSWPGVTRPVRTGGLGFDAKWDMGWMHDSLDYLGRDPIHRRHHHNELTFRGMYAWNERYVLPLSHDEVVYGKRSLLRKMHGDDWRRRANLRLLYAWQHAQPGKKLLFMGGEIAQEREWSHDRSLDWHLLADPRHAQIQLVVGELNRLHRTVAPLHRRDAEPSGYQWIDANDAEQSVASFVRLDGDGGIVVCVFNFTPVPRWSYRIGVDVDGDWIEILNTDATAFGGSGHGNAGGVTADVIPAHGRPFSLSLTLPPLGALFLVPAGDGR